MSDAVRLKVALAGKPNSGKSSLFNQLTGLNQRTGNFPGITVEKKTGICSLSSTLKAEIIDLPGVYTLYPRSVDEKIVAEVFSNNNSIFFPDRVVLLADATNLKNCLLLLTQLIDLGFPTVLALNMMDLAIKSGQNIDVAKLSSLLDVPVVIVNSREGHGINALKKLLAGPLNPSMKKIFKLKDELKLIVEEIQSKFALKSEYEAYQYLQQYQHLSFLSSADKIFIDEVCERNNFFHGKYQGAETIQRYEFIQEVLNEVVLELPKPGWNIRTRQLDKILTHKVWGYVIFIGILFVIFQAIFSWAQGPMDYIDYLFAELGTFLNHSFPEGPFFDLITQGIIPGIAGIVIFIPQIAILFAFISILEESGYMARVVFIMDKIMRRFGLNGRSVVPLMSGWACAIPAIMATRTIDNWKDRLITIFVTPFMSCSARLPVYAILVALIIPEDTFLIFFNLQGITMMALYLLGFLAAITSAYVMKLIISSKERSYLILELPTYRMPKWTNVGYTIVDKTKAFVFEAGKIILAISIILWVLASYGPATEMSEAENVVRSELVNKDLSEVEIQNLIAAYRLEHSYAGIIGRSIEPAIQPLGYDWKIGIALITSFAAREVFVGTMATIYSLGNTSDQETIKNRLKNEMVPNTDQPRFSMATGFSLLLFYTFAMQCMSTLAIVKRETKSWKWPILQFIYMTGLAYVSALFIYQVMQ